MSKEEIPLQQLIELICLRPKMYTLGGTFEEIVAYVNSPTNRRIIQYPTHQTNKQYPY